MVAVAHEAHSIHTEDAGTPPPLGLVQLRSLDLLGVQDVPLELAAVHVRLAWHGHVGSAAMQGCGGAVSGVVATASACILHSSIALPGLRSSVVLLSALSGATVYGVPQPLKPLVFLLISVRENTHKSRWRIYLLVGCGRLVKIAHCRTQGTKNLLSRFSRFLLSGCENPRTNTS